MSQAAKYRRHAADCFAVAQHLNDPDLKATMLQMAHSWSTLADHVEQCALPGAPPALENPTH
jgi:hypothetical protein